MPRTKPSLLLLPIALLLALQTHAAQVLPQPVVESQATDGGSVRPDPVKTRAEPTRRLVYSCIEPGLRTFSDRPCGPLPQLRELRLPPPVAAGEAPVVGKASSAQKREHSAEQKTAAARDATAAKERAETCLKLETDLDELDARMRAGYPAREAGRMWDRWRDARTQLRAADC